MDFIPIPTDPRFLNLTDRDFERWTVLGYAGNKYWWCKCACNTVRRVYGPSLTRGLSESCGCLLSEITAARNRTHGRSNSREWRAWSSMKKRCYKPTATHYDRYGGRGIRVCDRWLNSFEHFLADMGFCPVGHAIERIDNDGAYCKENCVWATMTAQCRNRSSNRKITWRGETRLLVEWAAITGIQRLTIHARLKRGWTVDEALERPVGQSRM